MGVNNKSATHFYNYHKNDCELYIHKEVEYICDLPFFQRRLHLHKAMPITTTTNIKQAAAMIQPSQLGGTMKKSSEIRKM